MCIINRVKSSRKQWKYWSKQNYTIIVVGRILFWFPLIVGMIYKIPHPQIVVVSCGELLSYYGVAFGLFGSCYSYFDGKRKDKKEKTKELRPLLTVNVEPTENKTIFRMNIQNSTEKPLRYWYLYDEFIAEKMEKQTNVMVTFNKTVEELKKIPNVLNITLDPDILDQDGFPKYVQILCDDIEGECWNCCFNKIHDGDKIYYYASQFQVE